MNLGDRKNKLTLIEITSEKSYGIFKCDCGAFKRARISHVNTEHIKSCGCYRKEAGALKARKYNENKYPIGFRKGRLTLLEYVEDKSTYSRDLTKGRFKCDCGGETTCRLWAVEQGAISSCGCLQSETAKENIQKATAAKIAKVVRNNELATNHVIQSYIKGAIERGLTIELSPDEMTHIMSKLCHYCGNKPNRVYKTAGGAFTYNGIDRLNNDIGYKLNNCVPCCWMCNKIKGAEEVAEWISHIEKIVKYLNR